MSSSLQLLTPGDGKPLFPKEDSKEKDILTPPPFKKK